MPTHYYTSYYIERQNKNKILTFSCGYEFINPAGILAFWRSLQQQIEKLIKRQKSIIKMQKKFYMLYILYILPTSFQYRVEIMKCLIGHGKTFYSSYYSKCVFIFLQGFYLYRYNVSHGKLLNRNLIQLDYVLKK